MPVFFINLIIRFSWALYREMWVSNGEYIIDGNFKSIEYTDMLHTIKIPDSEPVIYPQSGHMTFVDRPNLFTKSIEEFLK